MTTFRINDLVERGGQRGIVRRVYNTGMVLIEWADGNSDLSGGLRCAVVGHFPDAAPDPEPGERYRHYKGGCYTVCSIATEEETLESVVVYRSEQDGRQWVRALARWRQPAAHGGEFVARFTLLPQ